MAMAFLLRKCHITFSGQISFFVYQLGQWFLHYVASENKIYRITWSGQPVGWYFVFNRHFLCVWTVKPFILSIDVSRQTWPHSCGTSLSASTLRCRHTRSDAAIPRASWATSSPRSTTIWTSIATRGMLNFFCLLQIWMEWPSQLIRSSFYQRSVV